MEWELETPPTRASILRLDTLAYYIQQLEGLKAAKVAEALVVLGLKGILSHMIFDYVGLLNINAFTIQGYILVNVPSTQQYALLFFFGVLILIEKFFSTQDDHDGSEILNVAEIY